MGGGKFFIRSGRMCRSATSAGLYFFSFLVDFFLEAGVWAALGGSGWAEAWGGGRACWVACWAVACCCWGLEVRVAVLPGM